MNYVIEIIWLLLVYKSGENFGWENCQVKIMANVSVVVLVTFFVACCFAERSDELQSWSDDDESDEATSKETRVRKRAYQEAEDGHKRCVESVFDKLQLDRTPTQNLDEATSVDQSVFLQALNYCRTVRLLAEAKRTGTPTLLKCHRVFFIFFSISENLKNVTNST